MNAWRLECKGNNAANVKIIMPGEVSVLSYWQS